MVCSPGWPCGEVCLLWHKSTAPEPHFQAISSGYRSGRLTALAYRRWEGEDQTRRQSVLESAAGPARPPGQGC